MWVKLAEEVQQACYTWPVWMLHTGLAHHVLCRTRTLWWHGQMKRLYDVIALITVTIEEVGIKPGTFGPKQLLHVLRMHSRRLTPQYHVFI